MSEGVTVDITQTLTGYDDEAIRSQHVSQEMLVRCIGFINTRDLPDKTALAHWFNAIQEHIEELQPATDLRKALGDALVFYGEDEKDDLKRKLDNEDLARRIFRADKEVVLSTGEMEEIKKRLEKAYKSPRMLGSVFRLLNAAKQMAMLEPHNSGE